MRRVSLVLAGGFCGTLARYLLAAPLLAIVALVFPGKHGGFPFDVFLINLSGAFALGLLYGLFEHGARVSQEVRLSVGTGFLGAYTTFSTLAYGGEELLRSNAEYVGLIYLLGSLALGVAFSQTGYVLAGPLAMRRRLWKRAVARTRQLKRRVSSRWLAHSSPSGAASFGRSQSAAQSAAGEATAHSGEARGSRTPDWRGADVANDTTEGNPREHEEEGVR